MSNKIKRQILLVNSLEDTIQQVSQFFTTIDTDFFDYELISISDISELDTIESLEHISLVICDFCNNDSHKDLSRDFIHAIRSFTIFNTVPIAVIFTSKKEFEDYRFILALGINYIHIKGNDSKQFFSNLYYLCFEDESHHPSYARLKGIALDSEIQIPAFVFKYDTSKITVETDYKALRSYFNLDLQLYEDAPGAEYSIAQNWESGLYSRSSFTYECDIPFASGWDDAGDSIMEDSYSTWFEEEIGDDYRTPTMICTHVSSGSLINTFLTLKNYYNFNIILRNKFDPNRKTYLNEKVDLLFVELAVEEDYETLDQIISHYSLLPDPQKPFLFVCGHNSKSEALRKLYEYTRIISSQSLPSEQQIKDLIEAFNAKQTGITDKTLLENNPKILGHIPTDISVTSLSENEITFKTDVELPLYSVIQINAPIPLYFTLIPPILDLSPNIHGHHYMGFFLALSENDSQYLRLFVKKYMNEPLTEWREYGEEELFKNEEKINYSQTEDEREETKVETNKKKEDEQIKAKPAAAASNDYQRRKSKNTWSKL